MLRTTLIVLLGFSALAGQAVADAPLTGLWKADVDSGPLVSGALSIGRPVSALEARIGKYVVPVVTSAEALTFTLPDDQGRFRGRAAGEQIRGFWIQPATANFGVEYVSPVALQKQGEHWTGSIVPLADHLTVYLAISQAQDGSLSAFLRNPELNLGRGRAFSVSTQNGEIAFAPSGAKQVVMHGRLADDQLSLNYQGRSFIFRRSDPQSAVGLNETTDGQGYSYQAPVTQDDGWQTGSLANAGIDEKAITALATRIAETKAAPGATPYIDSLLIARHGKLVFEAYFDGFDRDTPHTLRSAGKSLTSVLLGAAIGHGAPISVATPVYSLFPNYGPLANADPRKSTMKIEHLLTMSSGLACDDDDDNSPGNEDVMQSQTREPDWFKYTLTLPMVRAPGEKAVYCSAGVNLVFGALANATHHWIPELFDEYLAHPLDIHRYYMNLTPTGEAYGGGGIFLRPRDALKFGQLYLNGGTWNGKRVLDKAWIEVSTTTHSKVHDDSTYGYNWWLFKLNVGGRTYDEYEAGGNGGQIIAVIPALDTVVLFTGANYGRFDIWYKFQTDLLPNAILPAIRP